MPNDSESTTYTVEITLMTENGELPSDDEVERLISDQMSGPLDETTGLFCASVVLVENANNLL